MMMRLGDLFFLHEYFNFYLYKNLTSIIKELYSSIFYYLSHLMPKRQSDNLLQIQEFTVIVERIDSYLNNPKLCLLI